jgi:hypothetical protein
MTKTIKKKKSINDINSVSESSKRIYNINRLLVK